MADEGGIASHYQVLEELGREFCFATFVAFVLFLSRSHPFNPSTNRRSPS